MGGRATCWAATLLLAFACSGSDGDAASSANEPDAGGQPDGSAGRGESGRGGATAGSAARGGAGVSGRRGGAGSNAGSSAGGQSGRSSSTAGTGAAGTGAAGTRGGDIPPPDAEVDEPNLRVIAWNGHAAAVSFTFDDADPTQYDRAGPILDERGVPATFFIVKNTIEGIGAAAHDAFQALSDRGHELGNHTVSHAGSSQGSVSEVVDCHEYIRTSFGVAPITFAYPNVDITDTYKTAAAASYVASRGGGAGEHIAIDDDLDWHDLPSYFISDPANDPGFTFQPEEAVQALAETLSARAWRILTFHGIGDGGFYANTSPDALARILDSIENDDMWIDTFGRVATYLRAQQALEAAAASPARDGDRLTFSWTLPPMFDRDVRLRVLIDGGSLSQDGAPLVWNGEDGFYPVDPDKELSWTP